MGRGSDLFRYSGMANPDITSGANMILSGLGTPGELADKATAKQRVEMQDLRQAKADAMATPGTPEWLAAKEAEKELKMGLVAAEHNWKMENDKGYRATIVGTEEYELARKNKLSDETALLNAQSAARIAEKKADPTTGILLSKYAQELKDKKFQEVLAGEVVNIPTEKTVTATTTQEQQDKARTGLESAAVVNAGKVYNDEYTKLITPTSSGATYTLPGGEVIELQKPGTAMTPEEAHQKAMEKAKLLDVVAGNAPVIDEKSLPKIGTTETKVKYTPAEINQLKLDKAKELYTKGQIPASMVVELGKAITPVKTQKEKIDEAEYLLKEKEFQEKKASGYWKHSTGKGGGNGDGVRKELDELYKTYGKPDLIGTGDQARIAMKLAETQSAGSGYSDDEMKKAINRAAGVYGNPGNPGVDEDGFVEAVQRNLLSFK